MRTTDVRIWGVRQKERNGKPAYEVRWSVGGRARSATRKTKGLADKFRSQLLIALDDGEQFDTVTGLPPSLEEKEEKAPGRSWYTFALAYLEMKWPTASPNYRDEINEALTAVTKALAPQQSGRPADEAMQRALRDCAFVLPGPAGRELPADTRAVLDWVEQTSPVLTQLQQPAVMSSVLNAFKLKLDGGPAAAETAKRKRRGFVNALNYAVQTGDLPENPVGVVEWQKPITVEEVDPRVVANPLQAANLIDAVSYIGGYQRARGRRLVGMFAGMYYAGLRPAECVGITRADCTLPKKGWGIAMVHRTRPVVGKKWTGTGEAHDDRGLKNRAANDVRPVPLPPQLVEIWQQSVDTFGTADDGRLFFTERGKVVGSSAYWRVWSMAREFGLPPELVKSPLAKRPYDLRHSALSTWLNAGLDPTEVAARAGNSVEVLLARYAKRLHGRQAVSNTRIENLLREYE